MAEHSHFIKKSKLFVTEPFGPHWKYIILTLHSAPSAITVLINNLEPFFTWCGNVKRSKMFGMRYVLPYQKLLSPLYWRSLLYYYWMTTLRLAFLSCRNGLAFQFDICKKNVSTTLASSTYFGYVQVADASSRHYYVRNIHGSGEYGTTFYIKDLDYSCQEDIQKYYTEQWLGLFFFFTEIHVSWSLWFFSVNSIMYSVCFYSDLFAN